MAHHLTSQSVLPGAGPLSDEQVAQLRAIVNEFDAASVNELAEIEAVTVHDVKAVEYYIGRRLPAIGIENLTAMVHFGCTSEDINNLSYAVGIKGAVENVWLPNATALVKQIEAMAEANRSVPMLSRTHGQPATPTTLGKELAVIAHRLNRQLARIAKTEYLGKINGATGTYAAHVASVPGADWEAVAKTFVEGLGLTWNPLTTQIESHDWQAELYADIARFNRILHNVCTDIWSYISIGYFRQIPVAGGATGSSTMPHKVNPIRFENAEANLEISNGLLDTLGATLVTSRWQRDLTDSSSQRNIGVAFGHSLLAISNVAKGLKALDVAEEVLAGDLNTNWGSPGRSNPDGDARRSNRRRRRNGKPVRTPQGPDPRPARGRRPDAGIRPGSWPLPPDAEARLLALTPGKYTGIADKLVDHLQ